MVISLRFWLSISTCFLLLPGRASAKEPTNLSVWVYGHFRGYLNPVETYSPYELAAIACRSERLTRVDNNGRILGQLAQDWRISNGGRTYTFTLRDGPIQATHVLASFKDALSTRSKVFHKSLLRQILAQNWFAEITPKTFKLLLKQPYPPFLYLLTSPEFSITKVEGYRYALNVIKPNEKIEFQSRDPSIIPNKILFTVSKDISLLRQSLTEGSVDLVLGLPAKMAGEEKLPDSFSLEPGRFANPLFLQLNKRSKQLRELKVRQTIYSSFIQATESWQENGKFLRPHHRFMPPGVMLPQYYQELEISSTRTSAPQGLTFNLWFDPAYVDRSLFDSAAEYLKKMGVRLNLIAKPFREVSNGFSKFDIVLSDSGSYFPDPDSMLTIWPQIYPNFPFPGTDLLKELQNVRGTEDFQSRMLKYQKAITDFEKDLWVVPLFISYDPLIKRKSLPLSGDALHPFDLICK